MGTVISEYMSRVKKYHFLFEELVKRDFKQKYKRTILGMGWSILSPLLMLLVMHAVFSQYFGRGIDYYTTYLFCGNLIFSYFSEATNSGMTALTGNASIISKINVPKYIFLLSKNISSLINFFLTLLVFFVFVYNDGIFFSLKFFFLLFPILCLFIFNIGMGMIISAMFVFFKDIGYLYSVFTTMLMYLSAIFYNIEILKPEYQKIFFFNPVFCYINYFRTVVIHNEIPSMEQHLLCGFYALFFSLLGAYVYKKYNHRFLYYL